MSRALSKSDLATDCLFCRLPAKDDRKKGNDVAYEISSQLSGKTHKHAHSMATGQTGQKSCADALYHSQWNINFRGGKKKKKNIPVAFGRSTEMQTAGVQKGKPEDVAWAEAFTQVVRYCAENDEQIPITDLCEKLKEYLNGDDTPYTERNT